MNNPKNIYGVVVVVWGGRIQQSFSNSTKVENGEGVMNNSFLNSSENRGIEDMVNPASPNSPLRDESGEGIILLLLTHQM